MPIRKFQHMAGVVILNHKVSLRASADLVPKFFTLPEAEKVLPEVERLLRDVIHFKQDYEEREEELAEVKRRITLMGGIIAPREHVAQLRTQKDAAGRALKTAFERIQETGCLIKDLETGLVDFPTLYHGQEVYLCWKLGENGIGYWHHVEDGFRGRQPIDSEFLSNHRGDE